MSLEEFKQFIESIGFKPINAYYYRYNDHRINLYSDNYKIYYGRNTIGRFNLNDLRPLMKMSRSIKLKRLLS